VIGRELGGGAMSRLFVAGETGLGRQVVMKVLPPDLALHPAKRAGVIALGTLTATAVSIRWLPE
jgi:hypothetical protein